METEDITEMSDDIVRRFGMSDMFSNNAFYMDSSPDDEEEIEFEEPDDIIITHMDVRQPLYYLHKILKEKVGFDLSDFKFLLQDSQELEPHKNLVDQCVKGEGLVQINVQIRTIRRSINIVDVLKPTEAALAYEESVKVQIQNANAQKLAKRSSENASNSDQMIIEEDKRSATVSAVNPLNPVTPAAERQCLNWQPDPKFKRNQQRLKIPDDPLLWSVPQVRYWFEWATKEFQLSNVEPRNWSITGQALCAMTHEEFRKKIPHDPGNIFWTHVQLLKECKFVSVVHRGMGATVGSIRVVPPKQQQLPTIAKRPTLEPPRPQREFKIMRKSSKPEVSKEQGDHFVLQQKTVSRPQNISGSSTVNSANRRPVHNSSSSSSQSNNNSSGSSNNASNTNSSNNGGQMQLWQFLLELLTDREHTDVIQWEGGDGEFKLINPEAVARLWGVRKNKPAMNYEKLSRALRYYYDGDMISKVSGKRFAYKFDCDLKLLIGYDASELAALVSDKPHFEATPHMPATMATIATATSRRTTTATTTGQSSNSDAD